MKGAHRAYIKSHKGFLILSCLAHVLLEDWVEDLFLEVTHQVSIAFSSGGGCEPFTAKDDLGSCLTLIGEYKDSHPKYTENNPYAHIGT